ncbi:hypothetical protein LRY29_00525 [Candidatus Saccharibacteria bacterium]|nr:hypothetical protein [Candidatus Saccharibacteria bacterium]
MEDETGVESVSRQIESEFQKLKFTQTAGNSHYASRGPEDLEQRNASVVGFLQDDSRIEPLVGPTFHDPSFIQEAIAKYETMLDVLTSQSPRSDEDEMLIDKLIDKTGELFRYEELMHAAGAVALEDREARRRVASDLSAELIGGIDQAYFDGILYDLRDLAAHSQLAIAKELLERIGEPHLEEARIIELEDHARELIKQDLVDLYPGLQELIDRATMVGETVSPQDAVPLFQELLRIAGLDSEWTVELKSGGRSAETSSSRKVVYIGERRASFKNGLDALAVGFHEAIVHAGRAQGVSLPGYLDFEEGIATLLQQVISGEKRTPGVQYYLSIGLQLGMDRSEPRSYRDTFEILWRREALLMDRDGKEVDIEKARVQAQRQVHRTRRGGAVDTRDAAYFVGAQKAAAWLNGISELPAEERRQVLRLALSHRADPTLQHHVSYIEKQADVQA